MYRLPTPARWPLSGLAVAAIVSAACHFGLAAGAAQEKQPEKAKPADEKTELAEFLADAQRCTIRATKPEAVLKLQEAPVLNFTNPERSRECGSVFVWLDDGRPAVMGQFFRFDVRDRRLEKHALHSLSAAPLEAKFNDKLAWTPDGPGVEWKAFPDAPAVAAAHKERLLQFKQLVRPVRVNLFDGKDKATELRLVPRPLFEYAAPRAGVTDGAIFSYVIGTDPEAVLLVEAFDENKTTGFRYAFARFHFLRLAATFGGKAVWDVEADESMRTNRLGNAANFKKVYNSFMP